jgi:endonuclease/exonuclease/phosphatase family metal-dependent hydrolase
LSLKVVTYNTQAGLLGTSKLELLKAYLYVFKIFHFSKRMSLGMRNAIESVLDLEPDILCLNEVPQKWVFQVQSFLAEHGYKYSAIGVTSGWIHCWAVGTIVASKKVADFREVHLPKEYSLHGGGGSTGLVLRESNTLFIGTHMAWGAPDLLLEQIDYLAGFCSTHNGPMIIAGDFNRGNLGKTSLDSLREQEHSTHPSWNSTNSFDHILTSGKVVESGTKSGSSDHLILWAEIEF